MTKQQAEQWVRDHNDSDDIDESELEDVFRTLYERPADDNDREQGIWSLLCAAS